MKPNIKISALAVIVSAVLYMGSSKNAEACCGDGAIAAAGAQAAGATVAGAIATSTSTQVTWLTMIQETIANGFLGVMQEIQKQTAQIKQMEEARLTTEEALRMEQLAAEAYSKFEPSPRSCYEVAGGAAVAIAAGETAQGISALNQTVTERGMNTYSRAKELKSAFDNYKRFNEAVGELKNADIRADNLVNNSSLNDEQLEAAKAFANNVVDPIPEQNIQEADQNTRAGQDFIARLSQHQALLSVPYHSFNAAIAAKTPVEGLGSSAMFSKSDVSEQELMDAMIKGRFESPGWYQMLAGFDELNLLREQNKQMALGAWMDLKRYKQLERIEAILATDLALNIKNTGKMELQQARNAALR